MRTYKFTINGNQYSVEVADVEDNIAQVEVNGTPYSVQLDMPNLIAPKPPVQVAKKTVTPPVPQAAPATAKVAPPTQSVSSGSVIKSPLPGTILDVFVRIGDAVKTGQHLLLLEAMKMENNIDADRAGTVKDIRVQRGDSVMEGEVLIVIE